MGFVWSPRGPQDVVRMRKYGELKQFKLQEGHCNVPRGFSQNRSLGLWVNTQRAQYKLMNQGLSSSMTEERIHLLEDIGFMWSLYGMASVRNDQAGDEAMVMDNECISIAQTMTT